MITRFPVPQFNGVALAPREPAVAYLDRTGRPKIRRLDTGTELEMKADAGYRQSAAFSPDGRLLLTAGLDGMVHVLDVQSGELLHRLTSRTTGLILVNASPDGSRIAAGSVDGFITLWDRKTGREIGMIPGHSKPVSSLEFLPDGRMVSGAADAIRFWPAPGSVRPSRR
jgi:WD40 repeat protein